MKYLYTACLLIITLLSCKDRDWKYKIVGKKPMLIERHLDLQEANVIKELVNVVAYTNTIHGSNEDSIWYYNSDGSKMTILAPYILKQRAN
jgi:hypothetical protein